MVQLFLFLTAMSTGHEGSMSTGHANSPENLVNVRIPTMMEMDKTTTFSEKARRIDDCRGNRINCAVEKTSRRKACSFTNNGDFRDKKSPNYSYRYFSVQPRN